MAHESAKNDGVGFTKLVNCGIEGFLGKLVIADYLSPEADDYRFFFGQPSQASPVSHNIDGLGPDPGSQRSLRVTRPHIIAVHLACCGYYRQFGIMVGKMRPVS
jgi:hypothetical protein